MVVVQFSVDLAQESMAPSDVIYLQSTFNGWCGDCAPMARSSPSSDVWVRPRAKTLPAWLSRGPSSWLQASRTPRVDFGEEGINMLTVRVSHQMASQI